VKLELLGLQKSVELLANVAELDDGQIPPACLEIAQLCGRLPLCLHIVGNLIRNYGDEWADEVPTLLKTDMKSLTQGEERNLQEHIIQSGLDSITGADAPSIITLFKSMAIYAEDQVVPIAILNVLWGSIDPANHSLLSGIQIRSWTLQLVSRSIIIGSASKGLSMHDIVRDYTLSSHTSEELQQRQRQFVQRLLDAKTEDNESRLVAAICTLRPIKCLLSPVLLRALYSLYNGCLRMPPSPFDLYLIFYHS
jgi:hypothetical protein